jgi:hypothetical protein
LQHTREDLEDSIRRRVQELEQRREVRDSWDAERSLDEELAEVRSELQDYDRWKPPPGSSASLSKSAARLTARQCVVYR